MLLPIVTILSKVLFLWWLPRRAKELLARLWAVYNVWVFFWIMRLASMRDDSRNDREQSRSRSRTREHFRTSDQHGPSAPIVVCAHCYRSRREGQLRRSRTSSTNSDSARPQT
jgi:hypothetical protein